MVRYTFSGHETFHCRQFWLKKGVDYLTDGGNFNAHEAVVDLGVGRNMVTAIRYWLRAFGLTDESGTITPIAHAIFGEDGSDPYLENIGTVWLLHYLLITTDYASIYPLVFNEFRKERFEFTHDQLFGFLQRKCQEMDNRISPRSLKTDINILIRNYLRPKKATESGNPEDDFSSILIDLGLVQRLEKTKTNKSYRYKIESDTRNTLPGKVVLHAILTQEKRNSISFNQLLNGKNSIGTIFALSATGLMSHIDQLEQTYPRDIVFTDDAGIKELQIINRDHLLTLSRF